MNINWLESMSEAIHREFVYLWYYCSVQFDLIVRYWVFGILIGSVISVFAKDRIFKLFTALQGKKIGIAGVVPSALLGIASPLCMYGTIPIAASFSENGAPDDWLAAFMMSSVLLNPQLVIYSAALGIRVLVIRITVCFLCGIFAGLLIRVFYKNKSFFRFSGFGPAANRDTDPIMIFRLLKNIWRNLKATGPYFFLGILLTAMFQRYVPQEVVIRLFGDNEGFGVLMAAAIGIPLYVCGGGTIPILQQWIGSGMSLGSAAAFMTTGPATKITNLGALKIVLGKKHFAYYIGYVVIFAFITGLVTDMIF